MPRTQAKQWAVLAASEALSPGQMEGTVGRALDKFNNCRKMGYVKYRQYLVSIKNRDATLATVDQDLLLDASERHNKHCWWTLKILPQVCINKECMVEGRQWAAWVMFFPFLYPYPIHVKASVIDCLSIWVIAVTLYSGKCLWKSGHYLSKSKGTVNTVTSPILKLD